MKESKFNSKITQSLHIHVYHKSNCTHHNFSKEAKDKNKVHCL